MSIKISIKYEPGSLNFPERSIQLDESETLVVTRSSKKERSNYNNAIFESRVSRLNLYAFNKLIGILVLQVLSKPHAIISYESGKIFISDCGSSNGTYINNFRIGSTNKKSTKQEIFSQDILRLVTC